MAATTVIADKNELSFLAMTLLAALLFFAGCAVKLLFYVRPAIDVIILQWSFIGCEFAQMLWETGLEHEGHRIVQLFGF